MTARPGGTGVGTRKYRLYEIDRIISRTLAYAIVTGLLVGVYAGLVLLATQVLRFHSSVAVAMSTLAAAALFNPLRRPPSWRTLWNQPTCRCGSGQANGSDAVPASWTIGADDDGC